MFKPRNIKKIEKVKKQRSAPLLSRQMAIMITAVETLMLVAALIAIPLAYTSEPIFYEKFYSGEFYYQAWAMSTHAEVQCVQCHVEPGFGNYLRFKANATAEFYRNFLVGAQEPQGLDTEPKNVTCERCHSPARIVSPSGRLLIPHQKHVYGIKAKLKCIDCHTNLVHRENPRMHNTPSMMICMGCHRKAVPKSEKEKVQAKGDLPTADCDNCHLNFKAIKLQDPDYLKSKDYAPKDHQDFEGFWRKEHGKQAMENKEACVICHAVGMYSFATSGFCSLQCHGGVSLPHTQKFKNSEEHGKISKTNMDICLKCHDSKTFCVDCHHPGGKNSRIPWIVLHPRIFKVEKQRCFNCHGPHYCARCHIRAGKPDAPITYPPVPP